MTSGALIFAFNNEQTDYLSMAQWSAANIKHYLGIPVAVVTDIDPGDPRASGFDRVITAHTATGGTRYFEDYNDTVTWFNASRVDAYNLTPWDQTLVLDADYVVASPALRNLLKTDSDFLCHRTAVDMATGIDLDGLNTFGRHKLPMWWATVMMFRKSNTASYIFDCMHMVRENWQHYRDLYGIDNKTYRNDFALSIAIGIVSGHTGKVDEIPWPLMSVLPSVELTQSDLATYNLTYTDSNNTRKTMGWTGFDFHAMGKKHLENIIDRR